jgi:NADH-quinone oxidoreductase subunit A
MRAQLELLGVLLIAAMAVGFIFVNLAVGRLVRRRVPHPEKAEPYECGEPASGPAWVRFDLRLYVVALVFVIFDVELALLFPWAVVYGEPGAAGPALFDLTVFGGLLMVGYAFLWRRGYLEFARPAEASAAEPPATAPGGPSPALTAGAAGARLPATGPRERPDRPQQPAMTGSTTTTATTTA